MRSCDRKPIHAPHDKKNGSLRLLSSLFECVPVHVVQHGGNTACSVIVSLFKADRTSLDHLNLVDVCACMGILGTGSIHQDRSYQRFVSLFLYPWRAVPDVMSQEVEAVCCCCCFFF